MLSTLYDPVVISVSDGVNSAVSLNSFKIQINNYPPDVSMIILTDVTVKVGQIISFPLVAQDELALDLLVFSQEPIYQLSFVSFTKNVVSLQPSFMEINFKYTAHFLVSDGVNLPVPMPLFNI